MNVSKQIDELIKMLMKRGEPIASFVTLGEEVFEDLQNELDTYTLCTSGNSILYCTFMGPIKVKLNKHKPTNYIGINGRTVLDITVEDMLLKN